jgi:hypothetical protein
VISVGALFGALCGALMRLSIGASPLSLAMLVTIASTLTLFNLEMDLSYLVVTLAQADAGVLIVTTLPNLLRRRHRMIPVPDAAKFGANERRLRETTAP